MFSVNCRGLWSIVVVALLAGSGAGIAEDKKAPVESSTTVSEKDVHDQPTTVPADEDSRWQDMLAWKDKSNLAQTGHLINPAGDLARVTGRVMSVAVAKQGKFLVAKTDRRLVVVNTTDFKVVRQNLIAEKDDAAEKGAEGGSMHGLVVGSDGSTIYFTGKTRTLYVGTLDDDGLLTVARRINLAGENVPKPNPLGLALSPDGKTAVVALAVANEAVIIDLAAGAVVGRVPMGVCPYGVAITPDGKTAFVSNFGGPRSRNGDQTAKSVGTDVAVDTRSVALRGSVSVIDLARQKVVADIVTGIHPESMTLSPDGTKLYVVDSSGDGIAEIDVAKRVVAHHFNTKPQADLPYGSMTNGLAISADGKILFAANGGNNSVALLDATKPQNPPYGFIPAGGFPGSVAVRGNDVYIGNVLGYFGGLQKVALPTDRASLDAMSATARKSFHLAEIIRANTSSLSKTAPKPVPAKLGEPSSIGHVVYIIKENKKFDPVLGDIGRGNADPKLIEFGRNATPNIHAMADQFVVLDNYYCGGVLSCDGHQWATQGLASPIREKDWANAHISYDFGKDPLAFAGCGFIWDHLLRQGVSFRNFGEFDYPTTTKGASWKDHYTAWKTKQPLPKWECVYQVDLLKRYSDLRFPGWEMSIPDQFRADRFIEALGEFEKSGKMPEFVVIYLPNDHTAGAGAKVPTPRAYVADNDLATGRVVEALSKSPFWKDMAIFINEDDPQSGTDHVDGHRSYCLVVGPYVKRGGQVVSKFYNQSSVLHTICRIFGAPPMNQTVAMSPLMTDCFQDTPDFTPYKCLPSNIALDEMNPPPAKAPGTTQSELAPHTLALDFSKPDLIDDDAEMYSRWVWSTVRGEEPFPVEFFGPHGKGLAPLGLEIDPNAPEEDDDEEEINPDNL